MKRRHERDVGRLHSFSVAQTVVFKQKVMEDSRKLPLSYRKVKYFGALPKPAARYRLL